MRLLLEEDHQKTLKEISGRCSSKNLYPKSCEILYGRCTVFGGYLTSAYAS
jgi:hypothetical protein